MTSPSLLRPEVVRFRTLYRASPPPRRVVGLAHRIEPQLGTGPAGHQWSGGAGSPVPRGPGEDHRPADAGDAPPTAPHRRSCSPVCHLATRLVVLSGGAIVSPLTLDMGRRDRERSKDTKALLRRLVATGRWSRPRRTSCRGSFRYETTPRPRQQPGGVRRCIESPLRHAHLPHPLDSG